MLCQTSSSTTLILLIIASSAGWQSNSKEQTNQKDKKSGKKWEVRANITQTQVFNKSRGESAFPRLSARGDFSFFQSCPWKTHKTIPFSSASAYCVKFCLLWLVEATPPCPQQAFYSPRPSWGWLWWFSYGICKPSMELCFHVSVLLWACNGEYIKPDHSLFVHHTALVPERPAPIKVSGTQLRVHLQGQTYAFWRDLRETLAGFFLIWVVLSLLGGTYGLLKYSFVTLLAFLSLHCCGSSRKFK